MKTISKILIFVSMSLALSGCDDFLTKEPETNLSPNTFFSSEAELELWTNRFYSLFAGPDTDAIQVSDIQIAKNLSSVQQGTRSPATENWGTSAWAYLRYINYYLERSGNCPDETIRQRYDGVAYFFRALFYFEKVRKYGDIPYYDFVIPSNDWASLKRPRDSRGFVMKKVMEDLDRAITDLPDNWPSDALYRLSKNAARAMKARAALYEGTFRKYHSREPSSDKPWQNDVYNADNKFLREAAAAAKEIMDKGPFSLVTGDVKTAYRSLFTSAGLLTQEVIFGREYSKELSAFHETSWYYYSPTYGTKIAMTKKFMNTYLTTKGTPFTDIDGYKTVDFIHEFDGRDARMAQTVISPSYQMKISGRTVPYSPNWKVTRTGYHPIKWSIDDDADNVLSKAASWNSLPIIRYAEVLLNYAEAKAELGTLTQDDIDLTIKKLRDRVGMPNLDMAQANANPDPYLSAPETGYPNVTGPNKGVLLEIRRERTIELLQEGHRYYDLIRWKEGKAFTQPLLGIYIPSKGEYDLDGDGTPDIYLKTKGESPSTKAPLIMEIDQDIFLSEGDHGYISPHKKNPGEWNEERDYYYPIPTDDRSLTGGALTQNPGWNDGLDF